MGMYENVESLDKEIARITNELSKLDPKSDAYKAVRVSIDTLYKVRNDVYKVDTEDIAARDKSEAEGKQKEAELEVRKQELEANSTKIENERKQKEEELKLKQKELDTSSAQFDREMKQKEAELEVRKQELESAERQHKEDIKSQRASRIRDYVVTGITTIVKVTTTLAAAGLTYVVAKKGYEFEQNGCPTSKTFRDELKNAADLFKDLAKSK